MIQHTWDRIAAKMKNPTRTQKLARAARAVPLNPTWFEPMEPRRLMAVSFNVDINDPTGTYQEFYDPITRTIEAAGDDWGENFDSNATIEIELRFEQEGFGVLATGGPVHLEPIRTVDGVEVVEAGPAHEIRTGADPNGSQHDGIVTFNIDAFFDMFFDPEPEKRDEPVPANRTDAYSVLLHELGHVIGFIGLKDDFTGEPQFINPDTGNLAMTTYDEQTENLFFIGTNAMQVYGEEVPLTVGNSSHYGNNFGPGEDLLELLMGPAIGNGEQKFIELLDIAIFADMGLPVLQDFTPPTPPTLIIEGTSRDDVIEIINSGAFFIVRVNAFTNEHAAFDEFGNPTFTGFEINSLGGDDVIILDSDMPAGVIVNAGDGRDRISGSDANDTINGGAGGDFIHGNGGQDRIDGGGGHDRIFGDAHNDRVFGGNGNDTIEGGDGHDSLFGADGDDEILGNNNNDTLYGGDGNDTLSGLNGADQMNGGSGADLFRGGRDFDFVDYEDATGPLIVTLDEQANDGVEGEGDNLAESIDTIRGGNFDDYIQGDGRNNQIHGGTGRDTLLGGSGNDRLLGDSGPDRLYGTSGDDTLEGGGGHDRLFPGSGIDEVFGGTGDDHIFAIDREEDTLFGGSGIDRAEFNVLDNLTEIEDLVEGSN